MINEKDRRTFVMRATQGHVVDKDATMHVLGQVKSLYRDIGMSRKQRRQVMGPHEERLLGGNAEEQFETARVIFDVHEGLQLANESLKRSRALRGSG